MTYTTIGCDVSIWQDAASTPQQINFNKMKAAGASFVFIKASQANYLDQDLIYNWSNAKTAGLLRGAYHYLTYNISPVTQAEYFWSVIKGDPGELPLVIDFENRATGLTRPRASGDLKAFCDRFTQLSGKKLMIYTSPSYWNEFGTTDAAWQNYPLWIAHYTNLNPNTGELYLPLVPAPWKQWLFWQYTSHGDGLKYGTESLNVDMNNFYGTLEQLYALAGLPLPILTTWEQQIDAWARQPVWTPYAGIGPEGVVAPPWGSV